MKHKKLMEDYSFLNFFMNDKLVIEVLFFGSHICNQAARIRVNIGSTKTTCPKLRFDYTQQRLNTEILKQIFPEKEYRGLSPDFHIHASVSYLYIPLFPEKEYIKGIFVAVYLSSLPCFSLCHWVRPPCRTTGRRPSPPPHSPIQMSSSPRRRMSSTRNDDNVFIY
jgi:hypothetical protein